MFCSAPGFASILFLKNRLLEWRIKKEKPWVVFFYSTTLIDFLFWFYCFLDPVPPDLSYGLPWLWWWVLFMESLPPDKDGLGRAFVLIHGVDLVNLLMLCSLVIIALIGLFCLLKLGVLLLLLLATCSKLNNSLTVAWCSGEGVGLIYLASVGLFLVFISLYVVSQLGCLFCVHEVLSFRGWTLVLGWYLS
jgi:hypothetical protein